MLILIQAVYICENVFHLCNNVVHKTCKHTWVMGKIPRIPL